MGFSCQILYNCYWNSSMDMFFFHCGKMAKVSFDDPGFPLNWNFCRDYHSIYHNSTVIIQEKTIHSSINHEINNHPETYFYNHPGSNFDIWSVNNLKTHFQMQTSGFLQNVHPRINYTQWLPFILWCSDSNQTCKRWY